MANETVQSDWYENNTKAAAYIRNKPDFITAEDVFSTSQNGTVPKPTSQEVSANKVLRADGTWVAQSGGGGGASNLSDLDDTNISSPSGGQVLKYNSTNSKWENANESGGTVTDVEVDGVSVVNGQGVAEITMPVIPTINVDDVKVNGTSVVDSNQVAQITSYKEVTLAQYIALPSTKTSDGVMYCITDIAGGADGYPPLIYSDEEREVGVWRDGKPLYQKTINFGALPDAAEKFVAHNISNLDEITRIYGITNNSSGSTFPLPFVNIEVSTGYQILLRATSSDIVVRTGSDRTAFTNTFITVQYTKTTDTAGAGTWTTQGGYAHHYSTDEHVIGTWVDGKPLYEKTVLGTFASQATSLSVNIAANMGVVIDVRGFLIPSDNPDGIVSLETKSDLAWLGDFNSSSGNCSIKRGGGTYFGDTPSVYITVCYTKTTD